MSNENMTAKINETSIESLRYAISRKISSQPYLANNNSARRIVTDMDHQPYQRFFRGVYYYPDPVIFEREAGYRPLKDSCYRTVSHGSGVVDEEPEHCFELPCSTILPCRPNSKEKIDTVINNECIVQYR
jgi:hypothetical protein